MVGLYPRLAADSIRKNRRLYYPYILTCVMMVAMYYVVRFLSMSETVKQMHGGESTQMVLSFGTAVVAVFSVIFMFYTNSFLIRRRKKEFGLYNVLGMDKRGIGRILFSETIIVGLIALAGGMIIGIAVSKLAELGLALAVQAEVNYSFSQDILKPVSITISLYAVVFLLLDLNALRQVRFANPSQLIRSETEGEKPPKANWVTGVLGIVILVAAYALAVSIQHPIEALFWFFIAVIMVIIGTFLTFISGSVLMCKILMKNKNYYYQANHFVSVSSMSYRMKRNGAGLASICILLTMVLVIISSTTCLYIGSDDSLSARYPRAVCAFMASGETRDRTMNEELGAFAADAVDAGVSESGLTISDVRNYHEYNLTGVRNGNRVEFIDPDVAETFTNVRQIADVHFIDLDDYNRMCGEQIGLEDGEALLCAVKSKMKEDEFIVGDRTFRIVRHLEEESFDFDGATKAAILPSYFLVVRDLEKTVTPYFESESDSMLPLWRWFYEFDTDGTPEQEQALTLDIESRIHAYTKGMVGVNSFCESRDAERADFYGTFGGLFFLGVLLSIVFLTAAVLIIYYKQISEGYEDQARFGIMQKVGMNKQDIKRSINSQMLTVFFLPVVFAVMNIAFAFPVIYRLLMLFSLFNLPLLIATTAGTAAIFTILYLIVYRLTSKAYYSIVSDASPV